MKNKIVNIVNIVVVLGGGINIGLAIHYQNYHAIAGWGLVTTFFIERCWLWYRIDYLNKVTNAFRHALSTSMIYKNLMEKYPEFYKAFKNKNTDKDSQDNKPNSTT